MVRNTAKGGIKKINQAIKNKDKSISEFEKEIRDNAKLIEDTYEKTKRGLTLN